MERLTPVKPLKCEIHGQRGCRIHHRAPYLLHEGGVIQRVRERDLQYGILPEGEMIRLEDHADTRLAREVEIEASATPVVAD